MAEDDAGYVLQLLGVKEGTERLGLLSPEAIQSRMVNVIREMTVRASHARPLVIAVEDVQWLDQASQALAALVESLEGVAVLVVLTYRPGWEPPWMRHSNVTRIGLPPLSEPDSLALVTSVLQTERLPEPLPQLILAKAEGNPFFLEELARVVTEQGVPLPALTVPASVHEVLLARIDRLGDVPRRLLQVASVIGRTIPLPLLAAVWEEPEGLEDALDALSRLELLYERPAEGGRMLVFKHALIQDVAYDSVLEGRRRALHAAVGRALAELHADRQDQILELLAHHFGRSNADGAAVDYAILAAEKAQRRWAPAEALAAFDAALSRLAGMPDTVANRLRRIDAILKQAEARFVLGRHAEQIQALEGIRELVEGEQATDPRRRAAWHYWMGFLHSLTGGRPEVPIAYCREASRISEAEGFDDLHAFAESCLAQVNVVAGRLRAAKAAGERALATFEAQGNVWWACRTLWQLNSAALYLGEWADSLDYCRRSLAHGEAVSDARLQLVALWRIGSTHIQRGNATEGLQWCRQAWALSPPPFDAHMIKSVEGYGLLKSGDPEAGVAALEEALAWFDMSRLRYTRSTTSLRLAEGYLALGQRQRARELLDEVLDTSRDLGYRHHEGVAERLVGDSLLDEDPAAARAHLDTAERILTEVEARNELAKALVSQAQLRRAAGDWAGARARLEHALEIFERLDSVDGSARVREELAAPEPPSPS
jgi:tetratricopeptide (TPR) repeat protein